MRIGFEELTYLKACFGVHQVRDDFGKGGEDEHALAYERMRNLQDSLLHHAVTVAQLKVGSEGLRLQVERLLIETLISEIGKIDDPIRDREGATPIFVYSRANVIRAWG